MIEAAGHGAITEAEVAQQRFDGRGIGAGHPPVRQFDALGRCELGQPRRRIVARVEADREHVEAVQSDHPSRLVHGVDDMLGGRRANRTAGGVDQADHQRLAAVVAQRQ